MTDKNEIQKQTSGNRKMKVTSEDARNEGRLTSPLNSWMTRVGSFGALWALPAMIASETPEVRAEDIMSVEPAHASEQNSTGRAGNNQPPRPDFLRLQKNYRLPHQQHKLDVVTAFTAERDDCPGKAVPAGRYSAAAPFTDTGDTTGGNDTVRGLYESNDFYSQVFPVGGPDHVYSFTLTSTGVAPEIRVTSQSGSYDPAIYILAGESSFTCPAGPGSEAGPPLVYSNIGGNGDEVIGGGQIRSLPLNVPLYLFIDSAVGQSGPYAISMKDVTILPRGPRTKFDFDRDGAANVSVFRPSDGFWYVTRAQQFNSRFPTQFSSVQFGVATDRIVPADYDGDGATDMGVFRDGTWYWLNSSDQSLKGFQFGLADDIPQPADYDGDGRTELAVFRAGTWYTYNLATAQSEGFQFGLSGDRPVAADYDGDGRADYAVHRSGTWYLHQSDFGPSSVKWGVPSDILVPADYDGDDRTDLGVFRDGTWYILPASPGIQPYQFQFGTSGDIPAPANYLGTAGSQRHAQAAVFRQGVWYVRTPGFSSGPFYTFRFGQANDRPIPAAYQR